MKVVEAEAAIGFECQYCGEYVYESDNLDSGEDFDDCAVDDDVIACPECGKDNRVIRFL